jgi:hypothetical protein
MESNTTMQLRDIKPLAEIADSSIFLYWGAIVFSTIAAILLGYFLYSKLKKIKKVDLEKSYLEALDTIDWSSPKKASYRATHYGRLLATDERKAELFSQLLPSLERYKYKKEIDAADEEMMRQFELYRKVCHGSV